MEEETLLPSPMPPPQPRLGAANRRSEDLGDDNKPVSAHGSTQADISTPTKSTATGNGAGTDPAGSETRLSRSASIASRTNRLSITLPVAHPTAPPSRPLPMSSSSSSFPVTPNDLTRVITSPLDPADIITAIAAEERRILELREELVHAEANLDGLKMQWAYHEKKRAEDQQRVEQKRPLSLQTGAIFSAAGPLATPVEDAGPKRSLDEGKRKALLLSQQPTADDPSTPTQSRRRVFRGSHARTLSLLSPTKVSSNEEAFSVHEDSFDGNAFARSMGSANDPDIPFQQRFTPKTAAKMSKRSSWAPQSGNQAGGLKQVAGQVANELSATLWTIMDDLRHAAVGDEAIPGSATAMRAVDSNSRSAGNNDDLQNTIRASASAPGRAPVSRAFAAEQPTSPTPKSRPSATGHAKEKTAKSSAEATASKRADGKNAKSFTWAPLSSDPFDDNEWANWDTATVKSRWSGSTTNGDASIMEQMDENTAPQKEETPMSPSIDISWPSALKGLTPSSLKRTATDLMRELEKSLAVPEDTASATESSHLRG